MFSNDYMQGFPRDLENDIDINISNANMNTNTNSNTMYQGMAGGYPNAAVAPMMGTMGYPIVEVPQERVVHRNYMHEVPHVCPVNTRVINHHIYRHTYQPRYTCCEENVVTNEQCGSCCQYR